MTSPNCSLPALKVWPETAEKVVTVGNEEDCVSEPRRRALVASLFCMALGVPGWASAATTTGLTDPLPPTGPVTETVTDTVDDVAGSAGETLGPVTETVTDTTGPLTDTVTDAADPVTETVTDTTEPVTDTIRDTTEPVTDTTKPVIDTIRDTTKPVTDTIRDTTKPVTDTVQPVAGPTIDAAADITHPVTDGLRDVGRPVPNLVDDGGLLGPGGSPVLDPAAGRPGEARGGPGAGPAADIGDVADDRAGSAVPDGALAPDDGSLGGASGPLPAAVVAGARDTGVSLEDVARGIAGASRQFSFPLAVAALVLLFLAVQGRIDARDPKLAGRPDDDELSFA